MHVFWPVLSRCLAQDGLSGGNSVQPGEEGPGGQAEMPRAGTRPPVYLRIPPGRKGRRQRALLGLDDDEWPTD